MKPDGEYRRDVFQLAGFEDGMAVLCKEGEVEKAMSKQAPAILETVLEFDDQWKEMHWVPIEED